MVANSRPGSMQPWFPKREDSAARGREAGRKSRWQSDRPSQEIDWDPIIARHKAIWADEEERA